LGTNSADNRSSWNSFGRVNASERWRRPSAAMGRAMTDALVAEARVEPGMRVLDIACGTGEPAITIASALQQSNGTVVGADISPAPLKIAEKRARERGLTAIEFTPADVHQLPFKDGEFDRVTCRLGVMFFTDPTAALREVHRVLRPGGRVSLLAWGPMQQPYFDMTVGTVLRTVPELVPPPSGTSMFKFGTHGSLSSTLRDAGFAGAEERLAEVPWNWPETPEELWAYFQEVTIPFKPLFQAIPPDRRNEVDANVVAELSRRFDGRLVRFDAKVVIASATR
jgi:ubiquinone/menaquinone biosynthesis C-methylase UbiE